MAATPLVYVATVLGPVRSGILATADATQVGADVVYAQCCVTISDGGGGIFRWDAGGGTDDGGTIIVPAGTGIGSVGPCWRRIYSGAVNVRWFGAQGDGVTDDTCALQQALNFLMATPTGGKLYIPSGTYQITYTLTLVGDYGHNYVIEGDIGGETYNTQILWAGPPGCTMLDCWGINDSYFRHLTFNGAGHNLNAGGSSNPAVSTVGAGCCTWFHTKQYGTVNHPGLASNAASFFVCFEDVSWAGVVGGLYAACAVGDGPGSPGDLTVDAEGRFTAYLVTGETPPSAGQNAVDNVISGLVYSTILTQDSPVSQTQGVGSVFNVASATGFTVNRALIACMAGRDPWVGRVTGISNDVITVMDQNQLGLPFDMPAGSAVYTAFPNAVAVPLPPCEAIINMPTAIGTSACAGFIWEKCNFFGGGWDTTVPYWNENTPYVAGQVVRAYPDNGLYFRSAGGGISGSVQPAWSTTVGAGTTDSGITWTAQLAGAAQHCYACVAVYSGYNTEQFGWRDCNVFNQGGVFGVYSPANANNEWFMENIQFGDFSGAAVSLGPNNFAKLTMYQCATESSIGFGYFVIDGGSNSGCLNLDGCEVVYNAVGNPYTAAVVSAGPTRIERCVFQHQYYDLGANAQPLAISTGGAIIVENCNFYAEQYQVPVFLFGNDVFASYFGGAQHPGTNRTHQWGSVAASGQIINEFPYIQARLRGNSGNDINQEPLNLPDADYQPTTLFAVGPFSNTYSPSAAEAFRAQPRTTTSCYDVDWMQAPGGGVVYLCSLQDRTVVRGAVVECTSQFSGGSTFSLGTDLGTYRDLFASATPIPAQDGVLMSNLAGYQIGNTWNMKGNSAVALILEQAPTTGHLRVYLTTEVVQA